MHVMLVFRTRIISVHARIVELLWRNDETTLSDIRTFPHVNFHSTILLRLARNNIKFSVLHARLRYETIFHVSKHSFIYISYHYHVFFPLSPPLLWHYAKRNTVHTALSYYFFFLPPTEFEMDRMRVANKHSNLIWPESMFLTASTSEYLKLFTISSCFLRFGEFLSNTIHNFPLSILCILLFSRAFD